MPGATFLVLHDLALDQHGYVTADQAREAGIDGRALWAMTARGTIEHVGHGLYRDPLVPPSTIAPYMAAVLWPVGTHAVLSHDTALELLELSDASPAKIHLTVPTTYRVRRRVPARYVLHHADLTPRDTTVRDGIPITSAARTIRDCAAAGVDPALIRQAIDDGRRNGRLSQREAAALDMTLFAPPQLRRRRRNNAT